MARNGHDKQVDRLRREAAERRAALRRTAAVLEERLRERSHQVAVVVERTKHTFEGVDSFIHRNRYLVIGGALGMGAVVGFRRRRRSFARPALGREIRYVVERPRRSAFRSLVGALAAMALRQGLAMIADRFYPPEEHEHLMLPPGRPYAE